MILEKQKEAQILVEGEIQESTKMGFDKESSVFLMNMLSKFYSDGIGSCIRETASNALDSHREAGITEPIVVSLLQDKNGNYEFSVEDFGVGLDQDTVTNVISQYGKSTKRKSENQLGAFGLGLKSPLAYSSVFYFIGRKNGIERKWMMYEVEDEENKIDLLYETETNERNGAKFIVPVKYQDRHNFLSAIKEQLAYFENVYFNVEGINNGFKIYRNEDFQWSELSSNSDLHLCLDDVYYPIDFQKLGISRINFPIALRFGLKDGLFPLPARESLKYSPEAKKIINDKIEKVANYFINKYNENVKETDNIFDVIDYFNSYSRYIDINGRKLEIQNLEKYATIKFTAPKLKDIKYLSMRRIYDIKDYLIQNYSVKYIYSNNRFVNTNDNKWKSKINFNLIYRTTTNSIYTFTELPSIKKSYFRDTLYGNKYFIKKIKEIPLGRLTEKFNGTGYTNWINILQLYNHPKSEWRERIKEAKYIISLINNSFINSDNLIVSQDWIDGRKKERVQKMVTKGTNVRYKKLTGEVVTKISEQLERYVSGKNCKFVRDVVSLDKAATSKFFRIYGTEKDEVTFQKLYQITDHKIKQVILSDREMKIMKDINIHNWLHIDKFMEGKHIIFKRLTTAYLINELYDKYEETFDNYSSVRKVSSILGDNLDTLLAYKNKYYQEDTSADKYFIKAMLQVSLDNNLFDTSIYSTYLKTKELLEKLPFIEYMCKTINYNNNDKCIPVMNDLFKYYKQRINWENYKQKENENNTELV